MREYKIVLEVQLPEEVLESDVDTELANVIFDFGGQVLDSKKFEDITEK